MQIKTVGVLGCGLMGSGIAQVCASSGYKTIVREVNDQFLEKGMGRIKKFLDDGVMKGKVAGESIRYNSPHMMIKSRVRASPRRCSGSAWLRVLQPSCSPLPVT